MSLKAHFHRAPHAIRAQTSPPYFDALYADQAERDRCAPTPAGVPLPAGAPAAADIPFSAAATPSSTCAVTGCGMTAARNARGYCLAHDDAYLTRAFELTQDIGRGDL